jgi:hypothetical protein
MRNGLIVFVGVFLLSFGVFLFLWWIKTRLLQFSPQDVSSDLWFSVWSSAWMSLVVAILAGIASVPMNRSMSEWAHSMCIVCLASAAAAFIFRLASGRLFAPHKGEDYDGLGMSLSILCAAIVSAIGLRSWRRAARNGEDAGAEDAV